MSDDEVSNSLLNRLPGGSVLLKLPGSGLVVRTESIAKRVVSGGFRWFLGMGATTEEPDPEEALVYHNYAELRSAVQELIDVFDESDVAVSAPASGGDSDSFNDVEFLRATKIRIEKLEGQLKAERQARKRAENRLNGLRHVDDTAREQKKLCAEVELQIAKLEGVEYQLRKERAELELVKSRMLSLTKDLPMGHNHGKGTGRKEFSLVDGEAVRDALLKELEQQRQLRQQAESRLASMSTVNVHGDNERLARENAEAELRQLRGEFLDSPSDKDMFSSNLVV